MKNESPITGVGPYPRPWPDDSRFDPELLEKGDKRNVLDIYRYWKVEAIKADLDKTRVELEIAIENLERDFNMGTIVRTANAFNISKVHIIGRKQWNKRGAMVTDLYMNIEYHDSVEAFKNSMKQARREIVAIDIVEGAERLHDVVLPKNAVLVFGAEGPGLSGQMLNASHRVVMIDQLGSTRSVNVGVAAGIAMYAWLSKHALTH